MQTSILSFRRGPALLAAAAPRRVPLVACRRLLSSDVVATSTPAGAKGDLSTETAAPIADKSTISSFTGAPTGMMETRVVKIFQQAQGVQNATQNMLSWRMQWEDEQTQRWTNPLMGWTSTNDPLSNANMTLDFATAEDAARFCEQNGWKYEIVQPKPNAELNASPKKYADNFTWQGPKGRAFPDLYKPPPPPPPKS